ncbi:MAG: 30S ribosomal protein S9 [Candidatus Harrisonbacteria bacterium]|nr:30S ribosomal protein S9 [Candidatus Harrisonbacteria bacterium]
MASATKKQKYFEGLGGRKTASARVRLMQGEKGIQVNGVDFKKYFAEPSKQRLVQSPLVLSELQDAVGVSAHVKGSGLSGQASAVRHGIAKALIKLDPELRKKLKRAGFLSRDSRKVERKKYGLTKARRAPQWSKR